MTAHQAADENKVSDLGYVQITSQTAPILIKILELESREVTIPDLIKTSGKKPSVVHSFIKECEQDPRQFLAFNKWSSTKSKAAEVRDTADPKSKPGAGASTTILEIRPDKLVTNPLSARILLALAEASQKTREVNKSRFMSQLLEELDEVKGKYEDLALELEVRVKFLIQIGDICEAGETVPNIIWISWLRYHSQRAYLELLAQSPAGSRGRKK